MGEMLHEMNILEKEIKGMLSNCINIENTTRQINNKLSDDNYFMPKTQETHFAEKKFSFFNAIKSSLSLLNVQFKYSFSVALIMLIFMFTFTSHIGDATVKHNCNSLYAKSIATENKDQYKKVIINADKKENISYVAPVVGNVIDKNQKFNGNEESFE